MLELTKHSWEALASVTWGTLIKLTIKIQINHKNWRWWKSLSTSATMTFINTSASKISAYKFLNLYSWNLLDPVQHFGSTSKTYTIRFDIHIVKQQEVVTGLPWHQYYEHFIQFVCPCRLGNYTWTSVNFCTLPSMNVLGQDHQRHSNSRSTHLKRGKKGDLG